MRRNYPGPRPARAVPVTLVVALFAASAVALGLTVIRPADSASADATAVGALGVGASDLALSPDGHTLYALDSKNSLVQVVDTSSGAIAASISVTGTIGEKLLKVGSHWVFTSGTDLGRNPLHLALNPDGSRLYVSNYSGTGGMGTWPGNEVVVVDTAARKVIDAIQVGESPSKIVINPDGKHGYVSNIRDCTVSIFDVAKGSAQPSVPSSSFGIPGHCGGENLAVGASGKRIYVALEDTVVEMDATVSPLAVLRTFPAARPQNLAATPDGRSLYVNLGDSPFGVAVIDLKTGKNVTTIDTLQMQELTINAKSNIAYVASADISSILDAIDLAHNKVLYQQPLGRSSGTLVTNQSGDRLFVAEYGPASVVVFSTPVSTPKPGGAKPSAAPSEAPSASPTASPTPSPSQSSPALVASNSGSTDVQNLILVVIGVLVLLVAVVIVLIVIVARRPRVPRQ